MYVCVKRWHYSDASVLYHVEHMFVKRGNKISRRLDIFRECDYNTNAERRHSSSVAAVPFSLFTATQILTAEIVRQNDINSLRFAIRCGILYLRTGR